MIVYFSQDRYFTSLHFTALHFTSIHFTSVHFTSLHFISLHFTTLNFITLHFTTLHSTCCTSLHFWAFRHHPSQTHHFSSLITNFLYESWQLSNLTHKFFSMYLFIYSTPNQHTTLPPTRSDNYQKLY